MNHSVLFKTARGLRKQGKPAKTLHLLGEATRRGNRARAEAPAKSAALGRVAG